MGAATIGQMLKNPGWGLTALVVLAGCLSVPTDPASDAGGQGRDGAAGGTDGRPGLDADIGDCTTIVADDFEQALDDDRWITVAATNSGDITYEPGELIMTADPMGDSYRYVEMYSAESGSLVDTVFTARFQAQTGSGSEAWLLFIANGAGTQSSLGFVIEPDRLTVERTIDDIGEDLCTGCPFYDGSAHVWVRITSDATDSVLSWSADGETFSTLSSVSVPDYEPHLYIGTEAPDTSMSTLRLDHVSWLSCPAD